ncbi:MAG: ATP-binding protein [Thermodesulfovibrionales bacterium]|nr:ATP-binding protein [Thermodesulfovibrionales bacterium]
MFILFLVAYFAEEREKRGKSIVNNPYIYSLSLAVYCTSWTFYGSVGKAATTGLSFLTVYIGPTLMAVLWLIILKKIVTIAKENRITTISDFIGARYGNSLALAALVSIIAVIGIIPYIGLQIKAIMSTFLLISGERAGGLEIGLFITFMLATFAIIFGARKLVTPERQSGLVFAVAFESIIKLAALLSVGFFVTFGLFEGFDDILLKIKQSQFSHLLSVGVGYTEWFTLTYLCMMAIILLPRQFHMAVVENYDLKHITKAVWLFPLYLFLINIFVLPIAYGGLLLGGDYKEADYFVLTLPLSQGEKYLSLFVFIGGFSAATAMVIVESLALSTMVMNSIVMPALLKFQKSPRFPSIIINIKRFIIFFVVFLGYVAAVTIGDLYALVDIGLKSFVAVSIFVPSFLIGLYWKRGTKTGAIAGLIAGFVVWFYTLIIPALMEAGLIQQSSFIGQLTKSEFLNVRSLFGITGLEKWTHVVFWSLLFNLLFYVGFSVFSKQSKEEEIQSYFFVDCFDRVKQPLISGSYTINDLENILSQYLGQVEANKAIENFLALKNKTRTEITSNELTELRHEAEKVLAGAIGTSMASIIFENRLILTEKDRGELSDSLKNIISNLRLSRQELSQANRELSNLKEFTENILESTPIGVVTIDASFKIKYWNRSMEILTGIKKMEALNSDIFDLIPWVSNALLVQQEQKETIIQAPLMQTFKVKISPFKDPAGGTVITFEDITEAVKLERERKNILSMFAHDMKNPVIIAQGVLGRLLSCKAGPLTNDQREYLEMQKEELHKLQTLISDFLEFTRLETKEYKPNLSPVDIISLIRQQIEMIKIEAEKKKVQIFFEYDENIPSFINIDSVMIGRVITNLLDNAIKYNLQNGKVIIKLKNRIEDILVEVIDTGIGIPEEHISYIFDAFYRVSREAGGTGLGLTVTKNIVESHGGKIWVESRVGKGSTFYFTIPKNLSN